MEWKSLFFNYIDLLWVPAALITLHKGQRLLGALFVLACAFVMRLQTELMGAIGYPRGFFHLLDAPLLLRGQVTYAVFVLGFFVMAYFSPRSDKFVFIAASITILIAAFCISSAVMVL